NLVFHESWRLRGRVSPLSLQALRAGRHFSTTSRWWKNSLCNSERILGDSPRSSSNRAYALSCSSRSAVARSQRIVRSFREDWTLSGQSSLLTFAREVTETVTSLPS